MYIRICMGNRELDTELNAGQGAKCECIYTYLYVNAYTHIFMCMCIHIYTCVCIYICTQLDRVVGSVCIYAYIYVYAYAHVYVNVYAHIYMCMNIPICIARQTHTHTHTHTHKHTHTHTHIHSSTEYLAVYVCNRCMRVTHTCVSVYTHIYLCVYMYTYTQVDRVFSSVFIRTYQYVCMLHIYM